MRRLLITRSSPRPLVVAVAAFAGVGRPEAARGDSCTPDTVTTTGHGVVTAVPDEATVSAGVHTQAAHGRRGARPERAADERRHRRAEGRRRRRICRRSRSRSTRRPNDQSKVTGYVARQNSVSAKAKIAGAGALIDAAVARGREHRRRPDARRLGPDALYREALEQGRRGRACQGRGARARPAASAVGPVSSVTEQAASAPPVPVYEAAARRRQRRRRSSPAPRTSPPT